MSINIGIWTVELDDDGTLDTVIRVTMRLQPQITEEVRYSDTSHLRDDSGALTLEGFQELADDAVDYVETSRA